MSSYGAVVIGGSPRDRGSGKWDEGGRGAALAERERVTGDALSRVLETKALAARSLPAGLELFHLAGLI